jgi:hypothetical protein
MMVITYLLLLTMKLPKNLPKPLKTFLRNWELIILIKLAGGMVTFSKVLREEMMLKMKW